MPINATEDQSRNADIEQCAAVVDSAASEQDLISQPVQCETPEPLQAWNTKRAEQGQKLRETIAALMRERPGITAREVRQLLDPSALELRSLPGRRAIQLHMQAVRRDAIQVGQDEPHWRDAPAARIKDPWKSKR